MMKICDNPLLRQYAVVIIVNLSVVILGLGLAWPSPVLVKLRDEAQTVLPRPITENEGAWIVSIGFLTATIANFLPAYLVDRIGRKYSVILACVLRLIVCLLFVFADRLWMLLLGRGISGVLDSLTFTVVPTYASEIASKEVRGSLGTILQIFSSTGILIMLSMGPFISYLSLNIIYACMALLATMPVLFLPETPYFLYSKDRSPEALKVLTFLRGSDALAQNELKELASATTEVEVSKRELFTNRIFLKTISLMSILAIGMQLIGFNSVSFYLQTVLESTDTTVSPEIASVIIGCVQLISSFCTAFISDRFGRKSILMTTLIFMALGMVGLGTFFQISENTEALSGIMNFVPLASLILVIFGYSAGLGSLFFLMISEVFEGPARATGVIFVVMITHFAIFLTTRYFPSMILVIGPAITYWIFGFNCVLLILFILFCIPETKGKTFAEIQKALGATSIISSSGLRKFSDDGVSVSIDEKNSPDLSKYVVVSNP